MAANSEFEDDIHGAEKDTLSLVLATSVTMMTMEVRVKVVLVATRMVTVVTFPSELLRTSRPRLALRMSRPLERQQAARLRRQGMVMVRDVAAPRTLRQRAKCRCKAGICTDTFQEGDIEMIRAVNASMEKTQLDLLILGKISTVISLDATTLRLKKAAQTERKRPRCNYTHEGWMYKAVHYSQMGHEDDVCFIMSLLGTTEEV